MNSIFEFEELKSHYSVCVYIHHILTFIMASYFGPLSTICLSWEPFKIILLNEFQLYSIQPTFSIKAKVFILQVKYDCFTMCIETLQ